MSLRPIDQFNASLLNKSNQCCLIDIVENTIIEINKLLYCPIG